MSLDQLLSDHLDAAAEKSPVSTAPAPDSIRAAGLQRTNRRNALLGTGFVLALLFGGLGIAAAANTDDERVDVAAVAERSVQWSPVVATDDGFVAFRNVFDAPYDDPANTPYVEIVRSRDGEVWDVVETENFPPIFVQEHAFWEGGQYVVIGSEVGDDKGIEPVVATSTDLQNWTWSVVDVPEHLLDEAAEDGFLTVAHAVFRPEGGLVIVIEAMGTPQVTLRSLDLKDFTEHRRLRGVAHLGFGGDQYIAVAQRSANDRSLVLWESATGANWLRSRSGDGELVYLSMEDTAADDTNLLRGLHSIVSPCDQEAPAAEGSRVCLQVALFGPVDRFSFSPDLGQTGTEIDGVASQHGGELRATMLRQGEAGFAFSYEEIAPEGAEPTSERLMFSPDGETWRVVAEELDGWLTTMVVGESEIILTVMAHDSFETELVRVPLDR